MKRFFSLLLTACLMTALTGCKATSDANPTQKPAEATPAEAHAKTLVIYFSATGTTRAVAEALAARTGADLYELVPEEPYTADDLNYNVSSSRANREMNDDSARPAIHGDIIDVSGYDTILLGYPIWWGTMPRILNTFLDTYDLSGKTVLPFCTSGSTGVSGSVSDLRTALPGVTVRDGWRAAGANDNGTETWLRNNGVIK